MGAAHRAERVRSGVSMVRESAQTGNGDQMDAVVSGVGSSRDGRNGTGGRGCRKVTISLQSCLALLQASSAASRVHLYPYAVLIVYFPPTDWLADSCMSSFSCLLVNQPALLTSYVLSSQCSINALRAPRSTLHAPRSMLHAPCSIHNDPP